MPYTDDFGQPIDPSDPRYGPDPNTGSGSGNAPGAPPGRDPSTGPWAEGYGPKPDDVPDPFQNPNRIKDAYQQLLGRAPTDAELSSEEANLLKYNWDTGPNGGVLATIAARANNTPNSGAGGAGGGTVSTVGGGGDVGYGYSNAGASAGNWFGQMAPPNYQPFTEQFKAPTMHDASGAAFDPTQTFTTPSEQDMLTHDPGYQTRMDAAMQALQRSAAAKGTLLTGGTQKALGQAMQDYGSNEYDKYYGQSANTYGMNQGAYGQNYQQAMQEYLNKFNIDSTNQLNNIGTKRNNMLDAFNMSSTDRQLSDAETMNSFDIYNTLDNNYFNRLYGLASLGANSSSGLAGLGGNISDILTQLGNSKAAGTVGSGNAWSQGLGNAGNAFMNSYYQAQAANQRK